MKVEEVGGGGKIKIASIYFCIFCFLTLKDGADEYYFPYPAELSLSALVLFFCICFVRSGMRLSLSSKQRVSLLFLFLFFSYSLASVLWSSYQLASFVRVLLFLLSPVLFVFICYAEKVAFKHIAYPFIIFSALLTVSGLALMLFGNVEYHGGFFLNSLDLGFFKFSQPYYSNNFRMASFTGNSNLFGLYAALAVGFCFALKLNSELSPRKFLFFVVLLLVGVAFSQSRAAIGVAVFLFLGGSFFLNRKLFYTSLVSCLLVVIGFYVYKSGLNDGVLARLNAGVNDRDIAWDLISPRIWGEPLFGHGFGSVTEFLLVENNLTIGAHSLYYTMLYELGVIGFSLFLIFVCFSLLAMFFSGGNVGKVLFVFVLSVLAHQVVEVQILKFNLLNFIFFFVCAYIPKG